MAHLLPDKLKVKWELHGSDSPPTLYKKLIICHLKFIDNGINLKTVAISWFSLMHTYILSSIWQIHQMFPFFSKKLKNRSDTEQIAVISSRLVSN